MNKIGKEKKGTRRYGYFEYKEINIMNIITKVWKTRNFIFLRSNLLFLNILD